MELERLYVDERESTVKIGKRFGADPASVRYLLKKYSIPRRSLSESHLAGYVFTGDSEVLHGSLLGDGSLIRRNKGGSVSFSKSNIGYDHVFYGSVTTWNSATSWNTRRAVKKQEHPRFPRRGRGRVCVCVCVCVRFDNHYSTGET